MSVVTILVVFPPQLPIVGSKSLHHFSKLIFTTQYYFLIFFFFICWRLAAAPAAACFLGLGGGSSLLLLVGSCGGSSCSSLLLLLSSSSASFNFAARSNLVSSWLVSCWLVLCRRHCNNVLIYQVCLTSSLPSSSSSPSNTSSSTSNVRALKLNVIPLSPLSSAIILSTCSPAKEIVGTAVECGCVLCVSPSYECDFFLTYHRHSLHCHWIHASSCQP